jgi:tetraacyldisaccharide 4'-kinase
MNPLSLIFGAGVALRNRLYDRRALRIRRLARPVVSVGNLSVGGSGKTPLVMALGELLKTRGIDFDVLSRGYGRRSREVAVVGPAGTPEQFGDEPLLMARKLEVPVVVGADRYAAGLLAERRFPAKLHLLDDAFQHRRLHRDFDIVLLPASDQTGTLLPGGRLREPLSSLGRADAVVFEIGEGEAVTAAAGFQIWRMKRNVYLEAIPKKTIAFCGIARPHQFFGMLQDLGMELADAISFRDHHRYSEADIDRLLQAKARAGVEAFVTTEKDAVNLQGLAVRLQPLHIAQLRLTLEEPEQILGTMLGTLERRCGCRF